MVIEGRYWKSDHWWIAELPVLDAGTQARTKDELRQMVGDLIESFLDKSVKARVDLDSNDTFTVETSNDDDLFCLILQRQRTKNHLSQKDVAEILGYSSVNAYSAYEQGQRRPSLEKAAKLLGAVTGKRKFRLKVG